MTTTVASSNATPAPPSAASPRAPQAPAADLMPWRAFERSTGTPDHVTAARARRAAERRTRRLAGRVAALTGTDLLPEAHAEAVVDVAVHLREWSGAARPDEARDAELRRVLGGYDHHLGHHRYVLDGRVTAADLLLWAAVITLPVRVGEDRAAFALRGLDHLRAWARRLGRALPGPVETVAADALAELAGQARAGRGHVGAARPALGNVA